MEFTKQQLREAAKELNKVMGLKPPINTEADKEKLEEQIRKATWMVLEDEDLSEATFKVVDSFLERE